MKKSVKKQIDRFKEAAKELGADESEAAFDEKLKAITKRSSDKMSVPIGWYVRVTTDKIYDGVYSTVLYIAGFATPLEAEQAVRNARLAPHEEYEVLPDQIAPGRGPQPSRGEVRLVEGAV